MTILNKTQIGDSLIFVGSVNDFIPPNYTFSEVPVQYYTDSTGNSWDNTTKHLVCPYRGYYLCQSQLRPADNLPKFSYYQSVNTSNEDNPAGIWANTLDGAQQNRNGSFVSRIISCNVGDRLRMNCYIDTYLSNIKCSAAVSIYYLGF